MAAEPYRIEVKFAWWWTWLYLPALYLTVAVTMRPPNWQRVAAMAIRATIIRIHRNRTEIAP